MMWTRCRPVPVISPMVSMKKWTRCFSRLTVKLLVAEKGRLDVEMSFNKYSFNDNLDFPFSIPKNYKRK